MTSTGSFAAGLALAGLDLQAVFDAVANVCAAGGVAGPSVARSAFTSGQDITMADVNSVLEAYQRAWDASWNRPGTRQPLYTLSEIRAANGYPGARLAAVWTQCPLLSFHQTWPTWDDVTPALLSDDNVYVCMFDGGAGSSETGIGGGLSGADAILTPHTSSMPGYNATYGGRGKTTSGEHFYDLPEGFVQNMLVGRDRFTFICHAYADGQVYSNDTGPFVMTWYATGGQYQSCGLLVDQYGWHATVIGADGVVHTVYDSGGSPFCGVLSGPLWFGIYSRADGVWVGISGNRPNTHAEWDWKAQIAPSRVLFGDMNSIYAHCVWQGYHQGWNWGMQNIYQRYFVASKTEFF